MLENFAPPPIKKSYAAFLSAPYLHRMWWRMRYGAVTKAKEAAVSSDVEADIRNWAHVSRTWSYATIFTVIAAYADHLWTEEQFDFTNFFTTLGIAAAQVGGFMAMRRSNETRAYLGHIQEVLQTVTTRTIFASASAYEKHIACETIDELRSCARAVLHVLKHSKTFPSVDAFSLWARAEENGAWRMVAAIGVDEDAVDHFSQPILETETPGAGIVTNLAVLGQTQYYQPESGKAVIGKPEWFATNDRSKRVAQTLGVFMLADDGGNAVGAFALTSMAKDALDRESSESFSRANTLILDQCTVSLIGIAAKAAWLWRAK